MFERFSPVNNFEDATAPGVSEQIDAVLNAEPPRPEIEEAHDDRVELPGGFNALAGIVRTARVRELTGTDEEELARATTTEGLINTLLTRGVVSLGGVPANQNALDGLLVGDRDALILGIRRVCFGDQLAFEAYVCPGCAGEYDLTVGLDEIPMVLSETPGEMTIMVPLRRGRTARVRLVTGRDQASLLEVSRTRKLTGAEQDSFLLSRTVLAILNPDGTEFEIGVNPDYVKALPIADRRAIMKDLHEKRPGPRMDGVKITCPDCREEQDIVITVDTLFRA